MAMIVTVTLNPALDRTLTVPSITFNEMIRATATRLDWGGKGFNVARALRALGQDVLATGFVGGTTGRMLEQGLNDLGIATDFVHIAGETRTNVVITDQAAERYVKVNETGPQVQPAECTAFLELVQQRVQPQDIWVLSGSLPPGVAPGFYAQLVRLLRAGGARVFLDTSGEPLRQGCAAGPTLVKPNQVEAQEATGRPIDTDADARDAAGFFLQQGAEMVALSLGADGLVLASESRAVWARPPRVQARNPVGAGDALLAGIAYATSQDLPLDEMARWGVAAGTASAIRDGVDVGTSAEVQALYEQVHTT